MRRAALPLARRSRNAYRSSARSYSAPVTSVPPFQITTLPNKIRVTTEDTPGHFSSVGLYVDAGSLYETPETSGVSHFLDRLAFKSTTTRSEDEMEESLHSLGGQIMCNSTRETMMYQSAHFDQQTPLAVSLMADTVINPRLDQDEIASAREAARYEIKQLSAKPETVLPEVFHGVAYNHQGLGNTLLCPEDRLESINSQLLRNTMQEWYRPERMVVAGAGMPHQELVELVDKHFSSLKASTSTAQSSLHQHQPPSHILSAALPPPPPNNPLTRAASYLFPSHQQSDVAMSSLGLKSGYVGGKNFIFDGESEFNHVHVGYESVGIHDDDVYTVATMHILLGGGGSFSAGGPGKGMYSRLYTQILNHYPQIDHCASFHHIYSDSSLFGLFASFVPASSGYRGGNTPSHILPHLVHQLSLLLYQNVQQKELQRAKNQLKSSLMMALESRQIQVEDLGRQILVHGRRLPVSEMIEKIDQVQSEDIRRVANRIYGPQSGNKPTVLTYGHEDATDWQTVFRKYGLAD